VIVKVGYGCGPDVAETLQENNILCNYQSLPDEEAFTAAGGLRLGVSEMTRFGMRQADFAALAQLLAAAVLRGTDVSREVTDLRSAFLDLRYCFRPEELGPRLEELRGLL
jgi:aminomethyltransferase